MKQKKTEMIRETRPAQLVATRGRTFQGYVTKVFPRRIVVEFERTLYMPKYERFTQSKTRLHARTPDGMQVSVGDYVRVRESRPLSKIIHFVLVDVIRKVTA